MDVEIRTISPDEYGAYDLALNAAFSGVTPEDEVEAFRRVTEFDRCLVAVEEGAFVGVASAVTFRMTVPGGREVQTAGITGVGVLPTHRRRGINTALMRRQLEDVRDRGEPAACLFASEGGIYGRYGYGLATLRASFDVETGRSGYVRTYRPSGRVQIAARSDALPRMRALYEVARVARPGAMALDETWFDVRFHDPERKKETPYFHAIHVSDEGQDDAYAVYRVKHEWANEVPRLELSVEDLQASTPQAYADIWRYLFDVDLVHRVKAWNRPADEPLLYLLQEPRRLGLGLKDGLYLRIVDVPAALASRGYASEGELAIEIADRFCPWNEGRVALEVGPDGTDCAATDADPDIACTVNGLGAVYLGGTTFRRLHRAGQVEELRAGALARADAMFASDPAPWCPFMF